MSTPAAKRRRIDAATALSKPFRSPFKTPLKVPPNDAFAAQDSAPESPFPQSNSNNVLTAKTPNTLLPPTDSPKLRSVPALKPGRSLTTPRPLSKAKRFTSPLSTAALNADPDIVPLLRAQRELEKRLREVKEDLDAAEQALKIERESSRRGEADIDGELVVLMGKWRGASQQAAEELFGKVRDRVNRMGGPRAWKEAQKKQQEYESAWDKEEQDQANNNNNNDDDNDESPGNKDVEKRDVYAEYGIDAETENEKLQASKGSSDTGELPGQEDEFTMAMMLRTLNVDLDIVGYDREGQRWID